jgi:hypothetical protein
VTRIPAICQGIGVLSAEADNTAQLLVEMGIPPREAMTRVRKSREGAIENAAQERYILGLVRGTT